MNPTHIHGRYAKLTANHLLYSYFFDTNLLALHKIFSLINLLLSVHDSPACLATHINHLPILVRNSQCPSHHPHPDQTLLTIRLSLLGQQTHLTPSNFLNLGTLCSSLQHPLKRLHLHNLYHVFHTPKTPTFGLQYLIHTS